MVAESVLKTVNTDVSLNSWDADKADSIQTRTAWVCHDLSGAVNVPILARSKCLLRLLGDAGAAGASSRQRGSETSARARDDAATAG